MVYIITSGEYSDYSIRAVTLNKERAELLKKMYMAKGYSIVDIEEYQEDDTGNDFSSKEEMTEPVKYYHVCISKTGRQSNYVDTKYRFEHEPSRGVFGTRWDKDDKIDTDIYHVEVEAKDEEHAKKIAQDMYAQALAVYYDLT